MLRILYFSYCPPIIIELPPRGAYPYGGNHWTLDHGDIIYKGDITYYIYILIYIHNILIYHDITYKGVLYTRYYLICSRIL